MTSLCARLVVFVLAAAAVGAFAARAQGEAAWLERLPAVQLRVTAPSARVTGEPGAMRIASRGCAPFDVASLRYRIVAIVVQEWAFFGFNVVDQTADDGPVRRRPGGFRRGFSWLGTDESARLAPSIAGYWGATRDGGWILERQNAAWNGPAGVGARWRDPWSAAFVSWVMCESGLGDDERFRRHIAHHAYIDQAIEARDGPGSAAAYVAHDIGERPVAPGDLLCRARRGAYRTLADRRPHLGVGVRSHCDIVVSVEAARDRILAIGGNVRGSVSLKLLPATFVRRGTEQLPTAIGRGRGRIFAHLGLRAPPLDGDAFRATPTLRALSEHTEDLHSLERRLGGGALYADSVRAEARRSAVPSGPN